MRYFIFFLLVIPVCIHSQNTIENRNSVAIGAGFFHTLLTDEYVSPNEYAGMSDYYGFTWENQTHKKLVQFDVALNKAYKLKNHLSRAKYGYFLFHYRHMYFLADSSLSSDRFSFCLGPGVSLFYSDRSQIYVPINSSFGSGSVDFNARIEATISRKFSLASQLLIAAVSYANKSKPITTQQTNPGYQLLTVLTFPNVEFDLRGRFNISKLFYAQLVYSLSYQETSRWDYYRRIEDRIFMQLGIQF